jgi:hypothetical protein
VSLPLTQQLVAQGKCMHLPVASAVWHSPALSHDIYADVPHTARKKLEPKYQIGINMGPKLEGPRYKVLTYNERLKRDKYQVRIFRDTVTFESLPKVTCMHGESQLHRGGHIDLPEGEEVAP